MQRHILYLSYDGLTDPLGSSQVLPYVLGLEKLGYRYTVVSFEKPDRFAEGEAAIHQTLQGRNIRWIPLPYHKTPPILSTLRDVKALNKTVLYLLKTDPFELAHCRSYITSLTGQMLKKKYGIPFVFDMRAFYPDERADAGLWKKNHLLFGPVYRFFKKKEREFLQTADHTVVLTEAGAKLMRAGKLTGTAFTGKLSVIPCCADMQHFDYAHVTPAQTQALRRELGIGPNTFVLGYSGSVGTWYMMAEMLDFFKALLTQKSDALFLVLTRDNAEEILQQARQKGIPQQNLHIRPVTRSEMPAWLSVFNASVFFILPTFSKQASSPTKQGELMGMGILVVCNAHVGDTESIVTESAGGVVMADFGPQATSAAVEYCLTQTPDRPRIRQYGMEYYGLEHGIEKYRSVYALVLEGNANKMMAIKNGTKGTL